MSRRVRLIVEYDGTGLSGWQRQDNAPSVQGHLEKELTRLLGSPTSILGASRTDAGVHAMAQVAAFDTDHPNFPDRGIRMALNSALPPSIGIRVAETVDPDFHPRFQSSGKHYQYRVLARRNRSPLRRNRVWHIDYELDVERMAQAGTHLVGEHDFTSFRAAGCGAKTATRRITSIEVRRDSDEVIIDVRGNAFLRNMVRIVAGTLVEVGGGRRSADSVAELLANRDRNAAGITAPAQGLTLMRVFFPPDSP